MLSLISSCTSCGQPLAKRCAVEARLGDDIVEPPVKRPVDFMVLAVDMPRPIERALGLRPNAVGHMP